MSNKKKSAHKDAPGPVPMPAGMPILMGQTADRMPVDPNFEEGGKLREEASRALTRLLVHEAQHSSWRVESVAKALSALRSY